MFGTWSCGVNKFMTILNRLGSSCDKVAGLWYVCLWNTKIYFYSPLSRLLEAIDQAIIGHATYYYLVRCAYFYLILAAFDLSPPSAIGGILLSSSTSPYGAISIRDYVF